MSLTSVERLLFVRNVPIFRELRDDFLVRLASVMDEVGFDANYTIITEGQEGRAMYIMVSGQVNVHFRGRTVAQLKQEDCFGEMSVFDAEPRSASVTTLEPCECLVLTQQQLYDAIDETPGIAVNIIRLLSRRIRELNQDLNAARPIAKSSAPLAVDDRTASGLSPQPAPLFEKVAAPPAEDLPIPAWEGQFPYGNVVY
ncbi:MAG: Crp/Fnr family transcriptional regulator [Nodosilinea sp.]